MNKMLINKKTIGLACLTVAIAASFPWRDTPPSEKKSQTENIVAITTDTTTTPGVVVQATDKYLLEKAPLLLSDQLSSTSLDGTEPPSTLTVDAAGNLIIDNKTRDILDYFMSLQGEMSLADIRTLIRQWATQQASADVADTLLDILDRYQEYLHAFAEGTYASQSGDDIRSQMAKRRQQRDQIMGPQLSATLFENDDAYDEFSLSRTDVMRSNLSDAEKERAIEELEDSLPEQLASQYKQQRALKALNRKEASMRERGASEAEIYAMHQEEFGSEAAIRLEQLSIQREQWQQRYNQYKPQRDLIKQSSLADSDQQQQLEALRARLFNETERQRVAALDRIHSTQH